ncbi:hypothetical protein C8A03DRAFT_44698 [Achaetomium macrosporum]|uniref:PHD-type domain-containing protein n=1 Tax=Achaetomium macrosporum TaxID=79813 RepID=A0AAN7C8L7_9PEZI|nr:hypothetical protein C8A03DRAFT_44698 [Achaetomium macrosporum]
MTRVLAGPYCTQILGDLGAEVIKIEHPVRGDDTRAWGPPYAPYKPGSSQEGPGESAYFLGVNRNKKSVALSFQDPAGVEVLHRLAAKCDILVENYIPGSLKKYGLDYETIHKINPALIYASITGYGQTGPYSQRAGYDVMVEAEFGLMHITGARDGPPVKVGVAVTDLTTGLYTSNSIMAALLARAKTGKGQHIDAALSDCQTVTLANIASSCLISGEKDTGRWGTAHPSIVPYRSFKTKDGDILFGGGNDRLFGILCDGLGRPEWKEDPKFKINASRVANRDELEAEIEKITVTKTTQEWLAVFEGKGMPYAAVNDVLGTLRHEHTKARNMVVEVEHGECGPIKLVNTPIKYSESEPIEPSPEPLPKPDPASAPGSETASTPARPSFPPTRAPYIPQLKGEPGSLSAALSQASRSPSVIPGIPSATYEDVKRRLVMGMNTSTQMTMQMPAPPPVRPAPSTLPAPVSAPPKPAYSTAGMSAIRKVTAGLTASSRPTLAKAITVKAVSSETRITKIKTSTEPRGQGGKRKRAKKQDDDDDDDSASRTSSLSSTTSPEPSPPESSTTTTTSAPPIPLTMTKSGRQVLKPAAYNPAAMDAASKKARNPAHSQYGSKRTAASAEQTALCKKCSRMHSPATNQMVFCDGCNDGWHQLCHEPWIVDEVVRDQSKAWFCGACLAKRERHAAKRQKLEHQHQHQHQQQGQGRLLNGVKESWAGKPPQQKRAYLLTLSQQELVGLLMKCLELHPELPIFPSSSSSSVASADHHHGMPRSLFGGTTTEGLFPRADLARKVVNGGKAASGKGGRSASGNGGAGKGSQKEDSQERMNGEDDEFDPLAALWPKPGMGLYMRLPPDTEDDARLKDDDDYEAFSVIVYDDRGRKVEENGMKV